MRILKLFLPFVLVILIASMASAQYRPIPSASMKLDCKETPSVVGASSSYPGQDRIVRSSKPAKPAGKAVYAPGEVMFFGGVVYDLGCVPISGASIEMWQTNTAGKYRYSNAGELVSPDPAFAGSGHAISNNLGEFQFLTVFPGPYDNRAPHIHIKVTHPDFPTLFTEVFFEGDRRNANDARLRTMGGDLSQRLQAKMNDLPFRLNEPSLLAHFDIVLRGYSKYQQF